MSWIQDNKFLVGLSAITLALALALYFYGSSGSGRYDEAYKTYQTAASEVDSFERGKLYPTSDNVDGKRVALEQYGQSVDTLQNAFNAYRPQPAASVSPQEFSDALKKANEETRAAFGESVLVPEAYYTGFETYTDRLAPGKATGILSYQLNGVKSLMLALADAGVTKLVNVYRPALEEEAGQAFKPTNDQVARGLPIELTFVGPEKSLNAFLTEIANSEDKLKGHYYVIRSIRVLNAKRVPPKTTDAVFERPQIRNNDPGIPGGLFDEPEAPGALFEEADGAAGDGDAADGGEGGGEAVPPPAPIPAPISDTSRNLSQILGNEELQVFLRLDLMQVLPPKKLP